MRIIQALIIAIFILLIPFLAYIWMLGYPLKVGYYSIYIYTFSVFLLMFYPVRNLTDNKSVLLINYFKQLGSDTYIICKVVGKFLYNCISILLKSFTGLKKTKQKKCK